MKKLLLILFLSVLAFGQNQTAMTSDGKKVILKTDKTWEYEKEEIIKPLITKSYQNFVGDECSKVLDFVKTDRNLSKNEFETEKQFKVRLRNYVNVTKFPNTDKTLSNIVFSITLPDKRYDAENQRFNITLYKIEKDKYCTIKLSKRETMFGFTRTDDILKSLELEMTANLAKEVSSYLTIALYGFPIQCDYRSSFSLCFVPTKYVIFNVRTGEVYKEIIEEDLFPIE